MRILAFDTETTGIKHSSDMTADHSVPVQLAAKLLEVQTIPEYPFNYVTRSSVNLLIHQDIPIPEGAAAVHGISREITEAYGVEPDEAAFAFASLLNKADVLLGHNLTFDIAIMRHFYHDCGFEGDPFGERPIYDTMKASTNICRIKHPNRNGYKWPKLTEAHRFFSHWEVQNMLGPDTYNQMEWDSVLDERYANAHDALVDVDLSLEVFFSFCRYTGNDFGISDAN